MIWLANDPGARHFAFLADDCSDVEDMESETWPKMRDICVHHEFPLAFDAVNTMYKKMNFKTFSKILSPE